MEYKFLHCEECDNVVSMEDNKRATFVCPACGSLNKRERSSTYFGRLEIKSPDMDCDLDNTKEEGVISIPDADEDLLSAIMLLSKYGWSMKFIGSAKPKSEDED
jgi:predicted RNA-binding Zn-ribbon protein involved in translation (DUF1610 family)